MTSRDYLPFGRPNFSDLEIEAVSKVLRSGWIGMGAETIAFEKELAEFCGVPYVVAVNSCTSALFLSLLVSGVSAGDEVICPSLTWCSTANAALYLGAIPIFSDINPQTLCLDSDDVLSKITKRTKVVILVHYAGLTADIETFKKKLPEHITIIEDAAHAFGAQYNNGKPVGSSGHLTCFSFYANKNLSTGDGGAVALFDASIVEQLCSLRQHAYPIDAWKRFTDPKNLLLSGQLTELGYKMNYTDLQASIGRVQLARFDDLQKIRQKIAEIYYTSLKDCGIGFQQGCIEASHAKHLFIIQLPLDDFRYDRDEMVHLLREKNIGATIHYAPLHLMPLYSQGGESNTLPVTEKISNSLVTLPISASMTESDAHYVANTVMELLEKLF
jgi:dTDP-4-amino-4,6-dideoxygalactose transaminase